MPDGDVPDGGSVEVPDEVGSLLEQAARAFDDAQAALAANDLGGYQDKVDEAQDLLDRARDLLVPTTTTTIPSTDA